MVNDIIYFFFFFLAKYSSYFLNFNENYPSFPHFDGGVYDTYILIHLSLSSSRIQNCLRCCWSTGYTWESEGAYLVLSWYSCNVYYLNLANECCYYVIMRNTWSVCTCNSNIESFCYIWQGPKYQEIVNIRLGDGTTRRGQVLEVDGEKAVVQVIVLWDF